MAYTYQVKAFLKNISPSTRKDTILLSAGITKTATFPVIKAPTSLTLANNTNFVNLNWIPPTNQSGGARNFDGQTVYFKVNGITDSADVTISQNSYTHYTNNTSATPTTFSVRAYRKVNGIKYTSASIANAGFATSSNPSNLPLPQKFAASQNLPAHIRLSWTYPDYILADFRLYRDGSLIAVLTSEAREYYDYEAKGYQNYLYEIEASYSQTTTLKASAIGKLNAASSVMGRVFANNSKYGLPYIEVTASATGFFARTFTDSTGFYRIDNLPTQQSLPITVTVDGGNTKFSMPNFPATQTFNTDGERYKIYNLDFKSDYSPVSKDTAQVSDIAFITATPDPARKQVNIVWSPSNRNYDGFYIYRANTLIGTVTENDAFIFNDTEGSLGINYLYTVLPFVNGADGIVARVGKTVTATYPAVEPVIYLDANAKVGNNTVEVTWSHKWANHTEYVVSRNGLVIGRVGVNAATRYIDDMGVPGQLYNYEVVAMDSVNGVKTYSTAMSVGANFPILADVTDLEVSVPDTALACGNISRNHVYLQWSYASEVTGFWVYRNGELIGVLPYTETYWRDSSGTPTLASVYKVKAYLRRNGTNYSADGVEKGGDYPAIAPAYGFNATAVPDSGKVLLEWNYAEDVINGFELYRLWGNNSELIKNIKINEWEGRDFHFWDKTGTIGRNYHYTVKAYAKRNGIVYYSDFAPCGPDTTTYPSIPAPIVRIGMTANQVASDGTYATYVRLQWDYAANNLDGFKIYRGATLVATVGKGMREYFDVSNTTGVFNYQIKAYKMIGNFLAESLPLTDNGNIGQASPATINPLVASQGVFSGAVQLDWLPAGNVNIYKDNIFIATLNGDSYTDNNVIPGQHYIYEVGPNANDRRGVEGWATENGYISGSVKTQLTNVGLPLAIVEAKVTIDSNTYYYTDSTDANGNYSIANIYYGANTASVYVSAALAQCNIEHTFADNPKVQLLSPQMPTASYISFFDLTNYKIKGRVTRQYSSCGIDSMHIYALYEYADGSIQNANQDAYSDPEGNYTIIVNPIQANLVKLTIKIDSVKGKERYRFQAQSTTEWTGQALYCIDEVNELNFEDVLTYPVRISVLNGCGTPQTGGRYKVQAQSEEVCYDRTFTIDQTNGEVVAHLPAIPLNIHLSGVENLTSTTQLVFEYLKFRPVLSLLDSLVELNSNTTNWDSLVNTSYWDNLTQVQLVYHKPPRIELTQDFQKHLCNDPQEAAIIQQGEEYTLNFQVLENFGSDCVVKNGYLKIRNSAAEETEHTLYYDATGILPTYSFKAANPNLVSPYMYSCYVSYYNLSNELLAEKKINIVVEGSSQLPGADVIVDVANDAGEIPLPLYVLRDPPGDHSLSKIEKGSIIKKNITLARELEGGSGLYVEGNLMFTHIGVGLELGFVAGGGNSQEYTWEVSTETTEEISTGTEILEVGKYADVIVGAGLAMQYGLAKKIKVNGCNITDSTIFALGPNGIKTTWVYTVGHIEALIAEFQARIDNKERLYEGGVMQSVDYSKAYFENKIHNWEKILEYHDKETLPYYNLCATQVPDTLSVAQKNIYNSWQNGFCPLVGTKESGHFEPYKDIVWNQALVDQYNVAELVLKNIVKQNWNNMPYDWSFSADNLKNRAAYIDVQNEAMHGISAENITFSAGTEVSKTIESAKASTTKFAGTSFFKLDTKGGLLFHFEGKESIAPLGIGFVISHAWDFEAKLFAQFNVEVKISEEQETAIENTNNISYTLADDDPYDQYSVTVIQGIEPNQTPYFSLLGGRSSCPDEPGTLFNDDPHISILKNGTSTKHDEAFVADANGHATFKLQVSNGNPFHSTRDIAIIQVVETNKHGASLKMFGKAFVEDVFTNISPDEPITLDLTVERGLNEYDYEDIEIVVLPVCYLDPDITYTLINGDTISISVHFANPCSDIVLAEPGDDWVIQRRNFTSNVNQEALPIKAAGFEVENNELQRIYFQYRKTGVDNDWKNIPNSYISKDSLAAFVAANVFPNEIPYYWYIWDITDDFERYPNGDYQIRVVAECMVEGKIVLSYSNISKGTIDRNQQLIGLPQPSDKIWTYGDEISISFIKDIDCPTIDSANFVLRNLNAGVNGVYPVVPGKVYCHNNKLSFIPNAPMNTFDGDTLQFVVSGVESVIGEMMNEETWSFGVYARDLYMDKTKFDVQLYQGENTTLISHFFNKKVSGNLTYSILGLTPIGAGNDGTYSTWLTARNARNITMAAGTNQTVYFDIDAANLPVGFYTVTFDVQDNTSPVTMYQNALTFNLEVVAKPANWSVNPANYEHSMTVNANYRFTNPLLPINTDTTDLISVWIDNEIRGIGKVQQIGAYTTAVINVFGNNADAGKTLTFRVWDTSTGTEYDAFPSIAKTYLKDASIGMIVSPLILNVNQVTDKARYIYLRQGWNLFSLNTTNANDSLNKVLASLKHKSNGDVIKTATKSATFNGTSWITANGLYTMDLYHGYQINLAQADTLRITGILPATLSKDSLFNGWNLIAAPIANLQRIETLLALGNFNASNQPDSMILKTVSPPNEAQYQNMVAYFKASQNPNWLYTTTSGMESIRPNYGYWLKVNKNTNLCMSSTACVGTTVLRTASNNYPTFDKFDTQTWLVNPAAYEFNMLITGYIEIDNELMPLSQTSPTQTSPTIKVAAYIENECRGIGELVYVPELGRYIISMFVYSNISSYGGQGGTENISFRIYIPEKDRFYEHYESLVFESDKLIGTLEKPYRFSNLAPDNTFSTEVYPNPFQYRLTLEIVSDVEQEYQINLTDLMGRVISGYTINETGTQHRIEIQTTDLKLVEGVYLLHIKGSLGEQKAVKVIYNP